MSHLHTHKVFQIKIKTKYVYVYVIKIENEEGPNEIHLKLSGIKGGEFKSCKENGTTLIESRGGK